ncbi:16S rRNA (cytidine(1402)-2'-O)-methyltransferase [Mycoplasma sp. NEAQ87857]|uniref:16S rRNA (cytidine(1402)-2'-O)-methyltransferase n=1 Tax=Mycoplasma sp. NEAQ87857 TaxID=2683967 RepID=UPI0013183F50|nr:16S rRNA (cytidine(1402)-2'-O)-methyltransferase [Mycoplasma sp. NEAQ87857]QGZ97899.1 16S rRNA (cytidine(1402)-2'-O)-methyltransferase [Mycoplasma sp. NEAQ87857]
MAKLYIVGVPIGNLEDITLRALKTLQDCNIIACEDTRVTKKLLSCYTNAPYNYLMDNKKLLTYNNYTENKSAKGIINLINQGNDVALVSDAGMPVVSDPGFEVIKQARENNIEVEIIPGVNAAITAFVASNFTSTFSFNGFIKDKTQQRINELKKLDIGTYIFYVSPHKLEQTLIDIDSVFANNAQLCLAKELTKMYEKFYYGTALEVLEQLKNDNAIKGEFTLVLNIPKIKRVKVSKYKKDDN